MAPSRAWRCSRVAAEATVLPPTGNEPAQELTWHEFLNVYQEPETGFWIVDGDKVFASKAELREHYELNIRTGQVIPPPSGGVDAK